MYFGELEKTLGCPLTPPQYLREVGVLESLFL
jgi:hypothetical protein